MRVRVQMAVADENQANQLRDALVRGGAEVERWVIVEEDPAEYPLTGKRLEVYQAVPDDRFVSAAEIVQATGISPGTVTGRLADLCRIALLDRDDRHGEAIYCRRDS